jgi:hypothetical protein
MRTRALESCELVDKKSFWMACRGSTTSLLPSQVRLGVLFFSDFFALFYEVLPIVHAPCKMCCRRRLNIPKHHAFFYPPFCCPPA